MSKSLQSKSLHDVRFPGETKEYRAQRDALLRSEMDLRRQTESVAAQRRELPLGGEVKQDYVFDGEKKQVGLSQLFRDGKDTLIIYSYMYGPQMAEPCPM